MHPTLVGDMHFFINHFIWTRILKVSDAPLSVNRLYLAQNVIFDHLLSLLNVRTAVRQIICF